jgi:putative holliday junction resolvase
MGTNSHNARLTIACAPTAVLPLIIVGRILSLDIGEKRIGIAVSDPTGTITQGVKVYNTTGSRAKDVAEIKEIANELQVGRIVVGLPKNLDGSIGPKAREIMGFADSLKHATGIDVDLWDERFSTDEAHRIFDMASIKRKDRRGAIDVMAAQIILQGYLDAQRQS